MFMEGFFNDEDRPDKSGLIAHFSPLDSGRIELDLTIDDHDKAVAGTVNRIHECGGRQAVSSDHVSPDWQQCRDDPDP